MRARVLDGRFKGAAERQAIEAEAIERFLKARASDTDADWDAAYAWVAADPARAVAFAKAEAGWELAERLREIPPDRLQPLAHRLPSDQDEHVAAIGVDEQQVEAPGPFRRRRRMLAAAIAASAAAIFATVAVQLDGAVDHYRTVVGERRTVRLADGSRIRLNTNTSVEVSLSDARRTVRLLRGEADFAVARDPARPFVVKADGALVRALGTEFAVRLRPDLTEVMVLKGTVEVRNETGIHARRVAAGNAAAVRSSAVAVSRLQPSEARRRLAWETGQLTFRGETLSQAVEEFNRYRESPIVIGDPMLAGLRIGGTFRLDSSEAFVKALERSFGVRAVRGKDGSLMLVPTPE